MTPEEIARTWIGTPYSHQASEKGAGADCLGLVIGIWRELYGTMPVAVPPYSMDWAEPSGEEALWRSAAEFLNEKKVDDAQPGDVLLFRIRPGAIAKHLGVLSISDPSPKFIHSYSGHGVVESSLTKPWRARAVAAFSFPNLKV